MRHFCLLLFLLISPLLSLFAQESFDDLIQQGIDQHDRGQYQMAIETYSEALSINPESALAHYEISLTYLHAKNYKKSIDHSNKVIAINRDYLIEAYLTKGSCLDYLGKTDASIKLLKKGIRKFGDDYLLHYNLGLNYYKTKDFKKAEKSLEKAVKSNPKHPTSHLLMAYTMEMQNKKVQSMLSLYYFLLLESNTERAAQASQMLLKFMNGNAERNDSSQVINISINEFNKKDEFNTANMMISLLSANRYLEENENKSEEELFIENTGIFLNILDEQRTEKSEGIWWEVYVPHLSKIAKSKHLDTYCYLINQTHSDYAQSWIKENKLKVYDFDIWLRGD